MPARFLSSGLVERIGHGPTKTTLEQKVEQPSGPATNVKSNGKRVDFFSAKPVR